MACSGVRICPAVLAASSGEEKNASGKHRVDVDLDGVSFLMTPAMSIGLDLAMHREAAYVRVIHPCRRRGPVRQSCRLAAPFRDNRYSLTPFTKEMTP
jgi:hypothetical protein